MDNGTLQRTMLFDFYGDMLTDKQRGYYDLHYNEDLSLAEIAEQSGISRQGVWDIIRRAEAAMLKTEEKTGLVRRYNERLRAVAGIKALLELLLTMTSGEANDITRQIISRIGELER